MESKPMSRPLPTLMYSLNLTLPARRVWLYPANTSSLMWKALQKVASRVEEGVGEERDEGG